jgi:hypothetical protein
VNALSHVFWLAGGKSTIARHLADRRQGVWLLPTPEFRRMAVEHRGSLWAIAGRTNAPERALGNLLERDRRFTDQVAVETRRLGLTSVVVDGSRTEDELTVRVAELFGLGHPG